VNILNNVLIMILLLGLFLFSWTFPIFVEDHWFQISGFWRQHIAWSLQTSKTFSTKLWQVFF
jgi:hypothetical protein